jgi:hypothetical protein
MQQMHIRLLDTETVPVLGDKLAVVTDLLKFPYPQGFFAYYID